MSERDAQRCWSRCAQAHFTGVLLSPVLVTRREEDGKSCHDEARCDRKQQIDRIGHVREQEVRDERGKHANDSRGARYADKARADSAAREEQRDKRSTDKP